MPDAVVALQRHRNRARSIVDKIERYAATGSPPAKRLIGRDGKRLRIGDFRALIIETETEVVVVDLGPRGDIYDRES